MSDRPPVSIVIPVYNGGNYLHEAIESALGQTYDNCEVIVVNDGSSDEGATEKIALSFGKKIRYYRKENGGVSSALNSGIQKMEGEYFAWLSHDDLFLPHKIESQIDFIDGRKDVVVYGDFEIIDSRSKYLRTRRERLIPPELFRYHLIFSHPVNGCTVFIPKKIFDTVGLFDEHLKTIQDYDLWYRIAKQYDFVHQDMVLARYREHDQQGSITVKPECIKESAQFYRRCFDEVLLEFYNNTSLSKLNFCMRSSIAFYNIGCFEVSEYATRLTRSILKSCNFVMSLRDYLWLPVFFLFEAKRALSKLPHDSKDNAGARR